MLLMFFFFKQKPAYEMRISDWSSDVCSSDLPHACDGAGRTLRRHGAASAAARSRNAAAQMDAPPFARFCYLLRLLPPARRLARAHRAAVEIARADRAAADHLARLRRHPDRAHRRDRRCAGRGEEAAETGRACGRASEGQYV